MKDFLQYILSEVKNKRISKTDAINLIYQFQTRKTSDVSSFLHPLIHKNTSSLSMQKFTSTFTGNEFFLKDYLVKGQRVIPGVAFLEMAVEAIRQASGDLERACPEISLKNVVWAKPVVLEKQHTNINIALFPEDSGEIAYEIYSGGEDVDFESVVYNQGRIVIGKATEIPALELDEIRKKCSKSSPSSSRYYDILQEMGMSYGDSYQSIENIYEGDGDLLVKLSLPANISDTESQFVLHPSIMDLALKAISGLGDGVPQRSLTMPFSMKQLDIYDKCTSNMWAYVRFTEGEIQETGLPVLDIDLCDEAGRICARIKGLSLKAVKVKEAHSDSLESADVLMLAPCWKEREAVKEAILTDYAQHLILLYDTENISEKSIEGQMNGVRCITINAKNDNIDEKFQAYAIHALQEIQKILKGKPKDKVLVQIVTPMKSEQQLFAGLSGLVKTARLENPKFVGQLIQIEEWEDVNGIIEKLKDESLCPKDISIKYTAGKRWCCEWEEFKADGKSITIPWKEQGVYLITGGVGGLGLIFAREIVMKAKNATIILTGRSKLNEEKETKIQELCDLGARVEYRQVDVSDRNAVESLIQSISKAFDGVNGIIHGAGVLKDSFILNKTVKEVNDVLSPKVSGLVNLDLASKEINLDFIITFSSVTGSLGNTGQADYSIANAFMDEYTEYRDSLVASKQRYGRMLSINWPLWKDGGMHVSIENEKKMTQKTGMSAMRTSTGISALYQGLSSGKNRIMVVEGDKEKMLEFLLEQEKKAYSSKDEAAVIQIEKSVIMENTLSKLKELFSEITKLEVEKIDIDESMETYGVDSVMVTLINQRLIELSDDLSKTLLYEYQTLGEIAEYLVSEYKTECIKWTGLDKQVQPKEERIEIKPIPKQVLLEGDFGVLMTLRNNNRSRKKNLNLGAVKPYESDNDPIAIIGMSGHYPQAKNLKEYWENLANGKNCISEIPAERWPLDGFYNPNKHDAAVQGKSYSKWGGFIDGAMDFDPLFFNISPRETVSIDPQERLFLQASWEALEDAGYTKEQFGEIDNRRIGVFVGITKTGFNLYGPDLWKQDEKIIPNTSFSSAANRISYMLNLHGPSMPIDTMCSSSLTAIHEACRHIRNNECEMAIVGGVNLYLHKSNYIGLCAKQMLSVDGTCKSFGKGGNGFVPGEGVGVVLLKRLSQAIADEDHIYALIRETNINHGGKTTGYTVPSPVAQGELIRTTLENAGLNARMVSYIEAHGTGTELGDPIEITGLTQAFRKDTQDTGFCAIGSVKSNIGHLEAAAGIAGIQKVVMQMNHKKIVPSLHSKELNPNINFTKTPFVVQQSLEEWKQPVVEVDGETRECPRIAGISSFGAGGSNAHVLIEEYIPQNEKRNPILVSKENPAVFVLSAKSESNLKEIALQLLEMLEETQFSEDKLADMAYTLQIGREAMEERLGFTVGTIQELEQKLKGFLDGRADIKDIYRGSVKGNKAMLQAFMADDAFKEKIDAWTGKRKYSKILEMWVKGLRFDWSMLYGDDRPQRMSLPTYPFNKEKYWFPEIKTSSGMIGANLEAVSLIHPLLHRNTSDLTEQRFSSILTGEEFFLRDHVVKGQKVLPGVAYLEMARAAVELAAGFLKDGDTKIRLKNVVWSQPVIVGEEPVELHIGLYSKEDGDIGYEVYSDSLESDSEPIVHSQGSAVLGNLEEIQAVNLKELQANCNQKTLLPQECYEAFKLVGLDYGIGHQGIERIYVGDGQALAKISIPTAVYDTKDQFVLHPSIMDSALQAIIGLVNRTDKHRASLPFALQELEIISSCTETMWAIIRYSKDSNPEDRIQKIDIDLCDENGNICIRLKAFTCRQFDGGATLVEATDSSGLLMLSPYLKEQAAAEKDKTVLYSKHLVILCEPEGVSVDVIKQRMGGVLCITLESSESGIEKRYLNYAEVVFNEVQNILKERIKNKVLIQIVICGNSESHTFMGLSGLLKTARLENPNLIGQIIEVESWKDKDRIVNLLKENVQSQNDAEICYKGGKRNIISWNEIDVSRQEKVIPWKENGVYLITGGLGRLGFIFAKDIVGKASKVNLVLTGRSPLDDGKMRRLEELLALGAYVEYKQIDVKDKNAVSDLMYEIQKRFGNINGIIHAAGIIQDSFIIKKTRDELMEVLRPKVSGLVNLDQASSALPLDFFIMFSSGTGAMGKAGQADYAMANAFMDAYASYRNRLVESKQRQGRTISINWPLWKDGGMHVDAETEMMMTQNTGMIALKTQTGIEALYYCLAFNNGQVMVMEGMLEKMRHKMLHSDMSDKNLLAEGKKEIIKSKLLKILSSLLNVKVKDIDCNVEIKEYMLDQFTQIEFANIINEEYMLEITPITFSDYQTLNQISEYLYSINNDNNLGLVSTASELPASDIRDRKTAINVSEEQLREKAISFFKKLLSSVIGLPANRIEADASMEKYGIDSIMVMQLTNELEKTFGSLSKTLFFEYQNIEEVTEYFIDSYREQLIGLLGFEDKLVSDTNISKKPIEAIQPVKSVISNRRRSRFVMNGEVKAQEVAKSLDVAIIGVSGKYPQADDINEFWDNLREGKDCIVEIPQSRWEHSLYFDTDKNKPGKTYSKWGGFVNGVDMFDPLFFNISPRDAEILDPQERLFLQCVYETLEDSGYTRQELSAHRDSDVGVYVGVMYEEYQLYGAQEQLLGRPVTLGGSPASIANRVSYFCNFHGPSIAIDTMCSSSLTAIHLACRSLQRGECNVAIAGGVNVSVHPNKYLFHSYARFASSKGRCESFGEGGDGYVPGEGVGAVMLKPLAQAIADGDRIYGIIKGTAINHGGKTNGYTVPNPNAQASTIERALKEAKIEPKTVSYIEAHGTGTSLGDPIEIASLNRVFQGNTKGKHFCAIGSVKSNIGHCESAAGIAGVTKVLLQLKYSQLVPSLHSKKLNPNIDFDNSHFVVQQELAEWKRPRVNGHEVPRRAGISSFGAGGSNAHVIIEEYVPKDVSKTSIIFNSQNPAVIVLSAKNGERLKEQVQRLLDALRKQQFSDSDLADIAYTLQVGRDAMDERIALLAGSIRELEEKLQGIIEGNDDIDGLYRGQLRRNKDTIAAFTADEDMEKVIEAWILKKKYNKLLDFWVKGLSIDWRKLYGNIAPRRISLPTYPFAKERYWAPDINLLSMGVYNGDNRVAITMSQSIEEVREHCYLRKQWEPCAVTSSKKTYQKVAIITSEETLGLAAQVSQYIENGQIIKLSSLQLQNEESEDFWGNYDGCIDLIGCGYGSEDSIEWLVSLQQLIEQGSKNGLMMLCVTKGLEAYMNQQINMTGASRVGLYRMLQSEYSHIRSRHMDVEQSIDNKVLAELIAFEFGVECKDAEICYRNGVRYNSFLEEFDLSDSNNKNNEIPEGHVLWVTGGTRGIGYLIATHMVKKHGVKKLVITGREAIPAREKWDSIDNNTSIARKIKAIKELEGLGAEVQVLSVLLDDKPSLEKCVEEVKNTMGPIGGVIHCAGISDSNTPAFIRKSINGIYQVLQPKVFGLNVLHQILKNEPLRFFAMFSSVSAIIPSLATGQSDYAMANAYMDYFSEANKLQYPVISIQWPSWKDTGMGEVKSKAYEHTGLLSISNDEGIKLFDGILSSNTGSVVMPAVVNRVLWQPKQLMKYVDKKELTTAKLQKLSSKELSEPSDINEAAILWLTSLLSKELRMKPSQLEADVDFQDYGVDSILLTQLLITLNQELMVDMDPSVLYEHSNIELLSAWLLENHRNPLLKVLDTKSIKSSGETSPTVHKVPLEKFTVKHEITPKQEITHEMGANPLDIAVIGMSARFPGASTLDEYWRLLSEGRSAIRTVPNDRWGYENNYYAGVLDDITHFDNSYFLIPEEDACIMDPQALLLLEESLKLLYNSGYSQQDVKGGSIGVYIGARSQHQPDVQSLQHARNPVIAIGQNYLSANISQFFDLRGPSIVIDTACSSALVGMNMAIQSLREGEIDSAIVGGIGLLNSDGAHRLFKQRGILNDEPVFHVFDQRAKGVTLGEGAGMVMLKTVKQAVLDGDHICAVIKGIAINNDGRTAGPATPNIQAQKTVMKAALGKSGIKPEVISYVEANGSGSEVTDLLELKAIQDVYNSLSNGSCGLGSIKPNIGHPLCAEGIASFIKVVLMLQNRHIVPFLSGEQPIRHFDMESSPFYFCRNLKKWENPQCVAALNCFADGGTNAHVILEAWEEANLGRNFRTPLQMPELNRKQLGKGQKDISKKQTIWETFK